METKQGEDMKIDRNTLVNALKTVIPGIDQMGWLSQPTDHFLFEENWIRTHNDHIGISFPLETGIRGGIKAKEFLQILSKMEGESLDVSQTENQLIIKDDKTVLKMNLVEYDFPNIELSIESWEVLPKEFLEGLRICLFSCSMDAFSDVLTGICVNKKEMLGTDNFRCSRFFLKEEMSIFIIPGNSAKEILKLKNLTEYKLGESWIHFRNNEGVIFSSRLMTGEYPIESVDGLFEKNQEGDSFFFPEDFEKTLDRVSILSFVSEEDGHQRVTIKNENGELVCVGEREIGRIEDRIKTNIKETFPEIKISPQLLKAILKYTKEFTAKENAILFETATFQHLIAIFGEE